MKKIEETAIRIQMAMSSLRKDEQGVTTVEYIILLALICIAAIIAWTQFGESIQNQATSSATAIDGL